MNKPTPMTFTWNGILRDELTRDDLIEAVTHLAAENERLERELTERRKAVRSRWATAEVVPFIHQDHRGVEVV